MIRFDANVPPLPGVPRIPIGESFARLNEYPPGGYRELHAAAAGYVGVEPEQIVLGAGSDSLIHLVARTYLGAGTKGRDRRSAHLLALRDRESRSRAPRSSGCSLDDAARGLGDLDLQSAQPGRERLLLRGDRRLWPGGVPDALVVIDEAYVEYGGESMVPYLGEVPNCVVLRTLSKAFGFAALRVGYAVCSEEVATELRKRSEPAPITAPSARIAAAALREPRLDVEETVQERERVRELCSPPATTARPRPETSSCSESRRPTSSPTSWSRRAWCCAATRTAFASPCACRPRTTACSRRWALPREPSARRSGLVIRTTAETAVRVSLDLDGQGRARIDTGIGFLDHLLTLFAFHGGHRSRAPGRRRSRGRRAPHGRGRAGRAGRGTCAGARRARRPRPLRLGDRADGRGPRYAPRSISAVARTPRWRSPSRASASAGWR